MDSTQSLVLFLLFAIWSSHHVYVHCQPKSSVFSVFDDPSARADGKTDNKQTFLNTWNKACHESDGGTLLIPRGIFLVSDAEFQGPCKGARTKVVINGIVRAPPKIFNMSLDSWLKFKSVNGLDISGSGTLDGDGAAYWAEARKNKTLKDSFNLRSLKLDKVNDGSIEGIHSLNSKKFHIGLNNCNNVRINNVKIQAPGDSPNTDGIHLGSGCNNIKITNSNIGTGDDCISMGDGVTHVNISQITCGPGHGISIGSIGKDPNKVEDVKSIMVTDCTLIDTQNGARIKTYAPSSTTTVSDITFQHLILKDVSNPIIIDQYYCNDKQCPKGAESSVLVKGVKFIDVRGTSSELTAVNMRCGRRCMNIELREINLTYKGRPTNAKCTESAIPNVRFNGTHQVPQFCQKAPPPLDYQNMFTSSSSAVSS